LTTFYEQDDSGACVSQAADSGGVTGYVVGAPMSSTALAALAYRYEGSGHVVAQAATAPTGERLRALSLYDKHLQTTCLPGLAADGQLRCLPAFTQPLFYFADAACTQPVVAANPSCAPPTFAALTNPLACSAIPLRMFHVGAHVTPPTLFIVSEDVCSSVSVDSGMDYYQVGAEIDATSFQAVTLGAD
jgi:hypothetical protein